MNSTMDGQEYFNLSESNEPRGSRYDDLYSDDEELFNDFSDLLMLNDDDVES